MSKIDLIYHDLLNTILKDGYTYEDPNRKGIKRKQINHYNFEYDLTEGFPALTTKKLAWKSVVGELIWILRGDTNIKYLVDNNIPIWTKDAYNTYCNRYDTTPHKAKEDGLFSLEEFSNYIKGREKPHPVIGSVGKNYGYQLRRFGGGFDQLKWLIDTLKNNPMATKKLVSYWNPVEKGQTALTPCHTSFSVTCRPTTREEKVTNPGIYHELSLSFNMESVDTFLGLPFNIAFYGLMTHILAKISGMSVGKLYGNLSNVHIYEPHMNAVKEQLERSPAKYNSPELLFLDEFHYLTDKDLVGELGIDEIINKLHINMFKLKGHNSYPTIKAEMLAYNK